MIEKDILTERLSVILENIQFLENARGLSFQEFTSNTVKLAAVKWNLLETIQACIDIASHIITSLNFRMPEDYGSMFKVLAKHDIISSDLAMKMKNMTGFRNILVHRYTAIDNEKLYTFLKGEFLDFKEFVKAIEQFLEDHK